MLISSRIINKNQNHRAITENNNSRGARNPKNLSYIPLSEISTGQNPRHNQVFYIQQPGRNLFCFHFNNIGGFKCYFSKFCKQIISLYKCD